MLVTLAELPKVGLLVAVGDPLEVEVILTLVTLPPKLVIIDAGAAEVLDAVA